MTSSRAVRFEDLTGHEIDAWYALRAGNPHLDSPYFDPGFARAVNDSGRAVTVFVNERDGRVESLMAVNRDRSILRPVGWPGADFQGPILAPGTAFSPL